MSKADDGYEGVSGVGSTPPQDMLESIPLPLSLMCWLGIVQ